MASSRDSSSSDEHETSLNTSDGEKKIYHRHSNHQIQRLEAYFKECPHPDESQRLKLGEELKLKANQIKFWFQNKRTQTKTQNEKADNASLRTENMEIRRWNEVIQEALNIVTCPPCGGPPLGQGERTLYFQNVHTQNTYLKEKRDRLLNLINTSEGHSKPSINALAYLHGPPLYPSASNNPYVTYGTSSNHLVEPPSLVREPYSREHINMAQPPHPRKSLSHMEKEKMTEAMEAAVTEVINLIRIEEPIWIKSSIDGRHVIDQKYYEEKIIKPNHFKIPTARIESSKEVVSIRMNAQNLVDMLLNTEKWANLFSTIVSKAETIHMLESTDPQRKYASKLMYEQLHILSPLLPPREFKILRSCRQLEEHVWVIADVSYHEVGFETPVCSKRPSGCLIQALRNGYSKVTWMEHVEVDDKVRTHRIYKDLLCGGFGYGARRWTATLERMCERLFLGTVSDFFPPTDNPGVVGTMNGRRNIMDIGERMLKDFAWMLKMPEKSGFSPQNATNSSGVMIWTRVNQKAGQPHGFIVCAGLSLCLPITPLQVYNFLKNVEVRHQWDPFCATPVTEVARFVTGLTNNENCVNILQPSETENGALIIQESFIDALGGMVIYAPVDVPTASAAFSGNVKPSEIPILPSGFIISRDARPPSAAGELDGGLDNCKTILTVAFQILTASTNNFDEGQMKDWTTDIHHLTSSTIQKVKVMLNCDDGQ